MESFFRNVSKRYVLIDDVYEVYYTNPLLHMDGSLCTTQMEYHFHSPIVYP